MQCLRFLSHEIAIVKINLFKNAQYYILYQFFVYGINALSDNSNKI